MSQNNPANKSMTGTQGLGTQETREVQKAEASQGANTLASGVPAPQQGGPTSPNQTQSVGAEVNLTTSGGQPSAAAQDAAAQPTQTQQTSPQQSAPQVEGTLPVLSGTHQMGVQRSAAEAPGNVVSGPATPAPTTGSTGGTKQ